MKVMSGLDARFLFTETPAAHMHTVKVVVVDTSAREVPLTPESLPALISDRLRRMPVLRRRVVPVPHGVGNPVMIDDPDFDLARHLRVTAAAPPGGPRQLDEVVARLAARPLPRDRPLWELTVVEGLADGRVAFVMKLHHALADGVAAVALLENAFVTDDAAAVVEGFHPEPVPGPLDLYRSAATAMARGAAAVPGFVGRSVSGVRRARTVRAAEATPPPGFFAAPRTPLNVALTPDRTFATLSLPMPEVAAVKEAAGVTVNDVFLALCGGGLRRYLQRLGRLPERTLVASVPLATRTGQQRLGGNHVDNLALPVHSDLDHPVARVAAVHEAAAAARRIRAALGHELFERRAAMVPAATHGVLPRLWSATRLAGHVRPPLNLVASCVRGPRVPLELEGGVVTSLFSSGPIIEGIGLNVTAWTYVDAMHVSVLGCSASLPDPWRLSEDLRDELSDWAARV